MSSITSRKNRLIYIFNPISLEVVGSIAHMFNGCKVKMQYFFRHIKINVCNNYIVLIKVLSDYGAYTLKHLISNFKRALLSALPIH